MHSHERRRYRQVARFRILDLQRPQDCEYCHGQGALSRWQDCMSRIWMFVDLVLTWNVQIDPKRAIPRDEQEKTSKIFVGGVSQETTDHEFKEYFAQFGRV